MGALTTAEAYDALSAFARSYGPDPLLLLLHASVPETLRPDILHLIQINFLAGPADPSRECSTTIWLSGRANLVDRSEGAC